MADLPTTKPDTRSAQIARYCFGLVGITWGLIVFGASVRVNGAGLACPDWPLCFGEVLPTIDFGVFFEFGHRVLASVVSFIYVGIGVAIFRTGRSSFLKGLWGLGLFVLGVQVILGGLTVLELLAEWTVTSHLLAGNTFCLMILLLALALRFDADAPDLSPVSKLQRFAGCGVALVLFVQIALGGLVSSSHAGLVCPSWPSCAGGAWFPTFSGLVGLQVTHRLVAYTLGGTIALLFSSTVGHQSLRRPAATMMFLVLLQIGLGVANIVYRLPVEVTLAHSGIAACLVLATTWFNWLAFASPLVAAHPSSGLVEAR